MGSCCGGDAPQPPNPIATAAAQTGTNVSTAIANSYLNNVNQVTPQGGLNYDVTGNYAFTDPATGQSFNIPRWTSTQSLSPAGQALQAQTDATKTNLAGVANTASSGLQNIFGQSFDPAGSVNAPKAANPGAIANVPGLRGDIAYGAQPLASIGNAGEITRSYGPGDNFSADRARVEEALYGRLNPQLQRERSNIEQRLAGQGIRYGSQAYARAMDDYNRQANDARLAVTQAAGTEQQRLADMAAKRAGFENSAQQQAYEQLLGRSTFFNQAQGTNFQQASARTQMENAARAAQLSQAQSVFNAQNTARNQYLTEQYQRRNQPINEITSLLSGSQIQNPNFVTTPSNQIPTTDIAGLINTNFNQQNSIYQQQQQSQDKLLGGLLGFGSNIGSAAILSDRRTKEDIHRIGMVFAADERTGQRKQLPMYEYSYKDDPANARHTGPMAQDVEKIDPGAIAEDRRGTKYINPRRVMGDIMRAA